MINFSLPFLRQRGKYNILKCPASRGVITFCNFLLWCLQTDCANGGKNWERPFPSVLLFCIRHNQHGRYTKRASGFQSWMNCWKSAVSLTPPQTICSAFLRRRLMRGRGWGRSRGDLGRSCRRPVAGIHVRADPRRCPASCRSAPAARTASSRTRCARCSRAGEVSPSPSQPGFGAWIGLWGDTPGTAPSATSLGLPCQALSGKLKFAARPTLGPRSLAKEVSRTAVAHPPCHQLALSGSMPSICGGKRRGLNAPGLISRYPWSRTWSFLIN